jgi:hypothetical protein
MTQRERQITIAEKAWAKEKPLKEREYKLKEEQREFERTHRPKISTSKLLIAFLFINCTIIEIFTGYVTLRSFDVATATFMMPDLTPLVTLIGAVISEVVGYAVYAIKSAKENTAGGIVYETAMMNCSVNDRPEEPIIDPTQDSVG